MHWFPATETGWRIHGVGSVLLAAQIFFSSFHCTSFSFSHPSYTLGLYFIVFFLSGHVAQSSLRVVAGGRGFVRRSGAMQYTAGFESLSGLPPSVNWLCTNDSEDLRTSTKADLPRFGPIRCLIDISRSRLVLWRIEVHFGRGNLLLPSVLGVLWSYHGVSLSQVDR